MRRRHFITLLAGTAGWPIAARTQQSVPAIGFLGAATAAEWTSLVTAFNRGLGDTGYVDGRNCAIEYRWAQAQYDRMPNLALDLVKHPVDVIAATGGTRSIQSANGDPTHPDRLHFRQRSRPAWSHRRLRSSLRQSDRRHVPGFGSRRKAVVPAARNVAALFNPSNPNTPRGTAELSAAAQRVGLQVDLLHASNESEIAAAFAAAASRRTPGLVVHADPFLLAAREQIVTLAARYRLPTIYGMREFAESGGIVSYGTNIAEVFKEAGVYTGRILSGDHPANLPVQQFTNGELIVNLGRAKALGVTIPASILARADQVIE